MKVALEKTHPLPVPADFAWRVLQDIEGVAACMPGAKITEKIDDTHYKGTVTVRVGPATVSFKGDIEIKGIDAAKRELQLGGKGSDTSGQSGASMDLIATVRETGPGTCELMGNSEVMVTGKAATFGGRMMGTVSDQILKQFFDNFTLRVQQTAGQAVTAAPPANEINAMALMWAIVKDFFRRLFGKKKAV
ncbi:MAG: SRPBCC family protein [Polaromonas sp.]